MLKPKTLQIGLPAQPVEIEVVQVQWGAVRRLAIMLIHEGEGRALHVILHPHSLGNALGEGCLARAKIPVQQDQIPAARDAAEAGAKLP